MTLTTSSTCSSGHWSRTAQAMTSMASTSYVGSRHTEIVRLIALCMAAATRRAA